MYYTTFKQTEIGKNRPFYLQKYHVKPIFFQDINKVMTLVIKIIYLIIKYCFTFPRNYFMYVKDDEITPLYHTTSLL